MSKAQAERIFRRVTARPRWVLIVSLAGILAMSFGLTRLSKDTSLRAFVPPDHPSIIADQTIKDVFEIGDPMAVAVTVVQPNATVFTPRVLDAVATLTRSISDLPNVNRERVASLATESSILGFDDGIDVSPYVTDAMDTRAARDARERWRKMAPHQNTLVSKDEKSALILFEVVNPDAATQTYRRVIELTEQLPGVGIRIDVAGPAAVSAVLSTKIDEDSRMLVPLVFVVVLTFIYAAFRRTGALLGPLIVLIGSVGGAIGLMAWKRRSLLRHYQRASHCAGRHRRRRRNPRHVPHVSNPRDTPYLAFSRGRCRRDGTDGRPDYRHHDYNHGWVCRNRYRVHHAPGEPLCLVCHSRRWPCVAVLDGHAAQRSGDA